MHRTFDVNIQDNSEMKSGRCSQKISYRPNVREKLVVQVTRNKELQKSALNLCQDFAVYKKLKQGNIVKGYREDKNGCGYL